MLSPSLEVRGMKPNSPAIHQLLIGDRIVGINGRSVTEPAEALLLIHNAPKKVGGNDGGFNDYQVTAILKIAFRFSKLYVAFIFIKKRL